MVRLILILLCLVIPMEAAAHTRVAVRVSGWVRTRPWEYHHRTWQYWKVAPARPAIVKDSTSTTDSVLVNAAGQTWKVVPLPPPPPPPTTTPYDDMLLSWGQTTEHLFSAGTPNYRVIRTVQVIATAYNSRRNQTDNTPWRTASNRLVQDGDIACNFLPLGTSVRIVNGPDIVRGKIFRVEDRLASPPPLGWNQIDVWMLRYSDAIAFRKQHLTLQVLSDPIGEAPH